MRQPAALLPGAREELHVAEFAAVHHQIVTTAELGELGISSSAASRWVACGRLRRQHQGVFVYGGGQLSQVGLFYAALRAIGDDAVLTRITGAVHHAFWPFDGPDIVHVMVPRQVRSRKGIRVHTVRELANESVTIWKGLRVTTMARTAIDLAGEPISDYVFGRSVHEAQVQGLTIAQLQAELQRMPARFKGRKRLTAEIDLGPTRTRSGLEEWGVAFLRRRHFPPFETNAHPPNTPPWVEVDVLFRTHGLAIELDSKKYHGTPWRRKQGAEKREIVRTGGTEVLVLTDDDAKPEREPQTVAKIWAALEDAAT
jgi:predicted transcriptional regulator of viral defense system